jgi:colanic acid/amylovoran biosynthesis glycosyltransferase
MSAERRVVIWRSALLPASETFVRHHGANLTRWRPSYLGASKVESALARDSDIVAFGGSFLGLRLTGRSPTLTEALRALRPDLVHAHFGGDAWLISRAAADLGVPLIVTVHGHDLTRQPAAPGLRGVRYRRNLRTVFDRACVVLAVSEHIRAEAIARGADPGRVRVHHTGVPIPETVPAVAKRWDVTFVGRFVEKKGVDDLLDALALLDRPRALLIGAGPLLGVDATFAGAQDPAAVRSHLAESRVLAAPSKTARDGDSEGLPTTILEAAALGLPVVATRHSGIPEAVVHGGTGLLSAEADPGALAAHLRQVLADDELRARLGGRGRELVSAEFDLRRQSLRLEDLYDQTVTTRSAPGPAARSAARPRSSTGRTRRSPQ